MKYLLIICILAASCSSAHKATNQQKQEVNKSSSSFTDSSGSSLIDTGSVSDVIKWIILNSDSTYVKITEEEIKEIIDSNVIHKETKRTIKEKGQKRTELSTVAMQKDSSGKQFRQQASVKQIHQEDSSAVTITKNRAIKRTTFLPWWIWLIALVIAGLAWWKRNSLIDLFI